MNLDEQIDAKVGEVRTDSIDISLGEIVNLYRSGEFIIQPDYQRFFRWSTEQRSRLIESVLLELPVPQIFVIENADGVFELIDGLQRISTVIHFTEPSLIGLDPLVLDGCEIVTELNGNVFEQLSLRLRLRIKRATVRMVVIRRQSQSFLRYEMFKRLNTGGSGLSSQEVRNCSARMLGEDGHAFYSFVQMLGTKPAFLRTTESLSQSERDARGDEELVLRFFAAKNARSIFKGSVRDWLDSFMERILLGSVDFNTVLEEESFDRVFSLLDRAMGVGSFVKHRDGDPIGALAPAYFEAVSIGVSEAWGAASMLSPSSLRDRVIEVTQSAQFKSFTGPGANSREKLENRIRLVREAIES